MSVRWQHCIDHADKYSKADYVTRLSSRRSSAADRQSVKRDYKLAESIGSPQRNKNYVVITAINYLQDTSSTISATWEGVWNTSKGEIEAKQLHSISSEACFL